jgi:BlaI family penicillinase repressor
MKSLTKAEEQVMQAVWGFEKAFLRDIVEAMPAPKPHQNTVATILKILVEKGFVQITVLAGSTSTHPWYQQRSLF